MRTHRCVPTLAAVIALAAPAAPAYGADIDAPGGGGTVSTVVAHQQASSSDWLIGVGAAAGVVLVGAGVAGSRRTSRRVSVARGARTAGGS